MHLPELLQLSGAYWGACTLHAGVKLDVFSHLVDESLTADELAQRLATDRRGLTMLLHALTALGLLQKEGERFRASELSAAHLSRSSADYMGHIIMHHHNLVESWGRLDQAVKSGAPVRGSLSHDAAEQERESFLMGMFNLASLIAPRIAGQFELDGRRRLLDLAGGPGTYAIHFCLQHPELTAVVFDLPTTRPFAEQTIKRFGLEERISFMAGDITEDTLEGGYDVVWISHLLHSEDSASSAAILRKAAAALQPGGLLLIQEFILDNYKTAPLFPALFALNMLINTPHGQSYTEAELSSLMAQAGLVEIRRLALDLPNGAGVMIGVRP